MTSVTSTLCTGAGLERDAAFVAGRPADANALVVTGARTINVPVSSSGSTLDFNLRIPTNAHIDPSSRIYNDQLSSVASPTLELGFRAVNGNITTTLNALTSGLSLSAASATAGVQVTSGNANLGKKVWQLLGLSADPGGFVDVVGTTVSASTAKTGNVTLDMKLYFN